jgi:hypothetical protein
MARNALSGALASGAVAVLAVTLILAARCSIPDFGIALLLAAGIGAPAGGALYVWAGRDAGAGGLVGAVVMSVAVGFLGFFALVVTVALACSD